MDSVYGRDELERYLHNPPAELQDSAREKVLAGL